MTAFRRAAFAICSSLVLTARVGAADPPIRFAHDIRPILARTCFACHGPDDKHREADLRLDTREGALENHDGRRAIVPGEPAQSELVRRILSNGDDQMPPRDSGKALTPEQKNLLQRWIAEGADWGRHWSFEPIVRPEPPSTQIAPGVVRDLDRFVLKSLETHGLKPAPEADKPTLARRVALDLTGLPPEPSVLKSYLDDASPQAYDRLVEALLESPAFGERWARLWLDIARYADTKGYEKDLARTMWRYRDWVIEAFNRDLPFDQFTREQLAGDLLPDATVEQQLATAFHRNTMVNDEGGTDNEEFRVAAVKDRVDTTLQAWMGLTFGCAKCHSHKYDPITQREYYQLYAYFNQTEDADDFDERPRLATPTRDQAATLARLRNELAELERQRDTETPALQADVERWVESVQHRSGWVVPEPTTLTAASGSKLERQADGSVLAEAQSPARETYSVTFPARVTRLTGIRLEALPDPTHPKKGVGRSPNDGNFVLSRITVAIVKPDGTTVELPLTKAAADFAQENYPVEHAIRNPDLPRRGWAVSPQQAKAHTAVFQPEQPVALEADAVLKITLDHLFEFSYPGFSLGRFRLSVTSDEAPTLQSDIPETILAIARKPAAERSADEQARLRTHVAGFAASTQAIRDRIAAVQKDLAQPVPQTPVLRELPVARRRTTRIHVRGNFLEQGETVEPAVPAAFHPFPANAPANRLGVAEWLMDRNNPLTARVAVNRVWAQFFGSGLVESQEDFGAQGQLPTHPELLDWLAAEFRDGRDVYHPDAPARPWSFKRLCQQIVLSSTYRQSSRATPEQLTRDPYNRLLARGPRFRLEAEMIRDTSLSVAGLLSRKMYGPSVMPPQPPGIWQSTYNTTRWETSGGEDRYRRGLYTFIKRTTPYPAMTTFDAPSRELCTVRRINTNTPLQALVTLNDPAFLEAAQGLARRMVREGGTSSASRIAWGLDQALVRPAQPREVAVLERLFETRRTYYKSNLDAAVRLATDPIGPAPEGMDIAELAALTAVGNVILNLDEFITRN